MLLELDVRHLPVVDEGQLVGIVSDRDFRQVSVLLGGAGSPDGLQRLLARPVSDFMSSDVISVDPEAEIDEIIDIMIEQKVGALPVVASNSELIGIVSYIDVLRAARDAL